MQLRHRCHPSLLRNPYYVAVEDNHVRRVGRISDEWDVVFDNRRRRACPLEDRERGVLDAATRRFGLSERARHRVLKVARTIADPAGAEPVGPAHLSNAIGLQVLDRDAGPL